MTDWGNIYDESEVDHHASLHPGVAQTAEYGTQAEPWQYVTGVDCVVCPGCAFTFDADHIDVGTNRYSCPCCGYGASQNDGSGMP